MHHHHKASPSLAGFPSALVTSSSLKAQMELLQQAPPSGHRANGSLDADLPIMRRRRGRRKNVEGLELLFMSNKRAGGVRTGSEVKLLVSYRPMCSLCARIHIKCMFSSVWMFRMIQRGQRFQLWRGFRMLPGLPTDPSPSQSRAPVPDLLPLAVWRRKRQQCQTKSWENG